MLKFHANLVNRIPPDKMDLKPYDLVSTHSEYSWCFFDLCE